MGILVSGISSCGLPDAAHSYLAQMIAMRTGISTADAEKRVDDVIARETSAAANLRDAANSTRKAAATLSVGTAFSMLIGAFIAAAAADYGGGLRDQH